MEDQPALRAHYASATRPHACAASFPHDGNNATHDESRIHSLETFGFSYCSIRLPTTCKNKLQSARKGILGTPRGFRADNETIKRENRCRALLVSDCRSRQLTSLSCCYV